MTRDDFRAEVIRRVKSDIGHEAWFRGVCVDNVDDCYPDLEEAALTAYCDTVYHDHPTQGFEW